MKLLSKMNEIKFEHVEKFCDTLIDVQNNLSKEFKYIDMSLFKMKNVNKFYILFIIYMKYLIFFSKEVGKFGFFKKFSEVNSKNKDNKMACRIVSKPDYADVIQKFILKTKDIEFIFSTLAGLIKQDEVDLLFEKRLIISMFLYNTISKMIFSDLKELMIRFLRKKILSFEQKK